MKVEKRTLVFSAIINLIVALIKISAGNIFNFASIIADGFYTVSDLITDVLAMIGAKVSKKRPDKRHPLGYGNFEYIMQMVMGFVIFIVGIVVIYMSFKITYTRPNLLVIVPLLIVIALKMYSAKMLLKVGEKINSSILVTSSKESFIDGISSLALLLVISASFVFKKADMVGSILIGIIIMVQAYKIIRENIGSLMGENITDEKVEAMLEGIFQKYRKISFKGYDLIKHGYYQQLIIKVNIAQDYTIKSLLKAELKIKNEIIHKRMGIKFIDFVLE